MGLTNAALAGKPFFRLRANGKDITKDINDRLFSLQLTDGTGYESDLLEVVLVNDDDSYPIKIPPKGAEIELDLGYDLYSRKMGMFVTDEIEVAGWPLAMIIRNRAAVFNTTKAGKQNMTEQKSRSWEKGTTIAGMTQKIAAEHEMKPVISAEVGSIELPHTDQHEESDLNLLLRICQKYDVVVKIAGGVIALAKRGSKKSASGEDLPSVKILKKDVTAFRWRSSTKESAGTVIAFYRATKKGARQEVQVGSGEPVRRVKTLYPSQAMATAAAKAMLAKASRDELELNITTLGNPDYMAEMLITISGIYEGIDGDYIVKSVTHKLGGEDGYSCDLVLTVPNSDKEPDVKIVAHEAPKKGSSDLDKDDYDGGVITLKPLKG